MILNINTAAASAQAALVHSRQHPVSVPGPSLVIGDKVEVTILLVDGAGAYDPIGGEPGATLKVAVGPVPGVPIAYSDAWTSVSGGWAGTVNLNTAEAVALLGSEEWVSVEIEIELARLDGTKRTLAQIASELRAELIPESPVAIVGNPSYLTEAQVSAGYVHNRSIITALTGGGATALDGIATASMPLGVMVAVVIGSTVSFYQIISSTAAENSPWVIRPDDYNAGSPKVWVLRNTDVVGFTHDQTAPASTWSGTHNLGYRPAAVALWIGDNLSFAEISVDATTFVVNFGGNYSGQLRMR